MGKGGGIKAQLRSPDLFDASRWRNGGEWKRRPVALVNYEREVQMGYEMRCMAILVIRRIHGMAEINGGQTYRIQYLLSFSIPSEQQSTVAFMFPLLHYVPF